MECIVSIYLIDGNEKIDLNAWPDSFDYINYYSFKPVVENIVKQLKLFYK